MIDQPGRTPARFPAEKEDAVSRAIRAALLEATAGAMTDITGIAGGACGGDILFHEQCHSLGIATEMYLALPPEEFKKESVSFAGPGWDERFDRLLRRLPVHILRVEAMQPDGDNSVWTRTNNWMLAKALGSGSDRLTLIAVWDGKGGDGPGGTQDMIETARRHGATTGIIDIGKLQ